MRLIGRILLVTALIISLVSNIKADCPGCPDNAYYYYSDECGRGGEVCVAGQAYSQCSMCNLRTGVLVGGPLVAALIAVLILTSDSSDHSH